MVWMVWKMYGHITLEEIGSLISEYHPKEIKLTIEDWDTLWNLKIQKNSRISNNFCRDVISKDFNEFVSMKYQGCLLTSVRPKQEVGNGILDLTGEKPVFKIIESEALCQP